MGLGPSAETRAPKLTKPILDQVSPSIHGAPDRESALSSPLWFYQLWHSGKKAFRHSCFGARTQPEDYSKNMFDKTNFVQSENMSINRERKASMSFYMLSKTYQV